MSTYGMVPLDEQKTEREELAALDLPWNTWTEPQVMSGDLALLRVEATGDDLNIVLPEGPVGRVTAGLLDGLGDECTFPNEFVRKLTPRLAAAVINERIDRTPPRPVSLVVEGDRAVRLLPGDRDVISPIVVADRAYQFLRDSYREVEVEESLAGEGEFLLRFVTPHEQRITPREGDLLHLGVQIRHNYRDGLAVNMYARRLVCLNGMTAEDRIYSWRSREDRSESAQLRWLDGALEDLTLAFEKLTERARYMAEERLTAHPRTVLQQAARSMGLSRRLVPELFTAFEAEPGDTHWDVLNAITRMATHQPSARPHRENIWRSAGSWVSDFDRCTATLPRPIARAVGAQILD